MPTDREFDPLPRLALKTDATLYGVWDGKSERNWKREEIDIDTRSEKLAAILERDHPIVKAHAVRQ